MAPTMNQVQMLRGKSRVDRPTEKQQGAQNAIGPDLVTRVWGRVIVTDKVVIEVTAFVGRFGRLLVGVMPLGLGGGGGRLSGLRRLRRGQNGLRHEGADR